MLIVTTWTAVIRSCKKFVYTYPEPRNRTVLEEDNTGSPPNRDHLCRWAPFDRFPVLICKQRMLTSGPVTEVSVKKAVGMVRGIAWVVQHRRKFRCRCLLILAVGRCVGVVPVSRCATRAREPDTGLPAVCRAAAMYRAGRSGTKEVRVAGTVFLLIACRNSPRHRESLVGDLARDPLLLEVRLGEDRGSPGSKQLTLL